MSLISSHITKREKSLCFCTTWFSILALYPIWVILLAWWLIRYATFWCVYFCLNWWRNLLWLQFMQVSADFPWLQQTFAYYFTAETKGWSLEEIRLSLKPNFQGRNKWYCLIHWGKKKRETNLCLCKMASFSTMVSKIDSCVLGFGCLILLQLLILLSQ